MCRVKEILILNSNVGEFIFCSANGRISTLQDSVLFFTRHSCGVIPYSCLNTLEKYPGSLYPQSKAMDAILLSGCFNSSFALFKRMMRINLLGLATCQCIQFSVQLRMTHEYQFT